MLAFGCDRGVIDRRDLHINDWVTRRTSFRRILRGFAIYSVDGQMRIAASRARDQNRDRDPAEIREFIHSRMEFQCPIIRIERLNG